jgi:ubiquinone/menaquinone biosynthesis C-methylase UbiE
MDIKQAYNNWAEQYDNNLNKTRDLESIALQTTLANHHFDHCLEIGCGTGKNSLWLIDKTKKLTGVDFSEEMLARAKEKVKSAKANFIQADINKDWVFAKGMQYDLITFSLMLEHIEHLKPVFEKVAKALQPNGLVYIGELHPFKQYIGSKARYDTEEVPQILECFNHNLSDFVLAAKSSGLKLLDMNEFFDDDDKTKPPRIITILLTKHE